MVFIQQLSLPVIELRFLWANRNDPTARWSDITSSWTVAMSLQTLNSPANRCLGLFVHDFLFSGDRTALEPWLTSLESTHLATATDAASPSRRPPWSASRLGESQTAWPFSGSPPDAIGATSLKANRRRNKRVFGSKKGSEGDDRMGEALRGWTWKTTQGTLNNRGGQKRASMWTAERDLTGGPGTLWSNITRCQQETQVTPSSTEWWREIKGN